MYVIAISVTAKTFRGAQSALVVPAALQVACSRCVRLYEVVLLFSEMKSYSTRHALSHRCQV